MEAAAGGPPTDRPVNVSATTSTVRTSALPVHFEAQYRLRAARYFPRNTGHLSIPRYPRPPSRQVTNPGLPRSTNDSICSWFPLLAEDRQTRAISRVPPSPKTSGNSTALDEGHAGNGCARAYPRLKRENFRAIPDSKRNVIFERI